MTLTLRCMRCGEWAEMDPAGHYGWGLCDCCWRKASARLDDTASGKSFRAFRRFMDRWQRGVERHPTYKKLSAALDAMERAEHGRMVDDV